MKNNLVACNFCTLQTRMNKGIADDVDNQLLLTCNFRTLYMQFFPLKTEMNYELA